MIYLLVDLKIVLALHPSDQNRGWSEGGAYPREGRLSKLEVLWETPNVAPDHITECRNLWLITKQKAFAQFSKFLSISTENI